MTAIVEALQDREPLPGRTTIAARVVERTAAQAITEVDDVAAPQRRGSTPVRAQVNGDTATLTVRVAVAYPTSVGAATERVRAHLTDRVETLTGLSVSRVDIDVAELRDLVRTGRVQ